LLGFAGGKSETGLRARRRGRFAVLLCAVLLFLVAVAVAASWTERTLALRIASSVLLVVALSTASGRRWILWCGTALASVAIGGSWGSVYAPGAPLREISLAATAAFLLLASGSVLAAVLADRTVTLDTIAGAIAVYLLLGVCFAFVHLSVLTVAPASYRLGAGSGDSADALTALQTFVYYSFTTLTTLGYGDIHPVHPLAELASNAEAVGGQLYIAVLVARLVSAYRGRGGGSSEGAGTS
jgi:hypothetical protein